MNGVTVNASEAFVLQVCQRSFLSLWCYNNPRRKTGKELCDILVVCDPHVVVISVKEVELKDRADYAVDHERWERKAVDASVKQIYGAQRWLSSATNVICHDGSVGLPLPDFTERRLHRIAVAFGARGEITIPSGDFGKGYVHVMCEESFSQILSELDTVTDVVQYLAAKEERLARGSSAAYVGSEANLLGWYLSNGRSFPTNVDFVFIDDTVWKGMRETEQFKRKKDADAISYVWDDMIEFLCEADGTDLTGNPVKLTDHESTVRVMARENRLSRRILGRAFHEFLDKAKTGELHSRLLGSESNAIYVFVYFHAGTDSSVRLAELGNRCFLARHLAGQGDVVVGIGISEHDSQHGTATDLAYLDVSGWSNEDANKAEQMQAELSYFADTPRYNIEEDEYPS